MERKKYQGDHRAFLSSLFSAEFISVSKEYASTFIRQLMSKIAIEKKTKNYIHPTHLFVQLNSACGDPNPDLDYEIFAVLNRLKLSSSKILSFLVADIFCSEEESLKYYIDAFHQQTEEVQGVMIEEYLKEQHDFIPDYLQKKLTALIYNFASEFDLSDGRSDVETFEYVLSRYIEDFEEESA